MLCAVVLLSSSLPSCVLFDRAPKPLPTVAVQAAPSFDGNHQDSGLIKVDPEKGALVTAHFVARYNALIDRFGHDPRLTLPLVHNQYVTPAGVAESMEHKDRGGVFWISKQGLADFITMNQWRREVLAPSR